MSTSLLVSAAGVLVAVAAAGVLLARVSRAPRIDLNAWSVALLGLVVALGAQTLGHLHGFGPPTFRAMEIGALEIAPLALVLGMCEIVGKSLPARFAARLFIPALAITPLVILSTDPLSSTAFTKATPAVTAYYELPAVYAVKLGLAPLTALVALVAMGVAGYRLLAAGPPWRDAFLPVVAAGVAALALALPGLAIDAGADLGGSSPSTSLLPVLCLLAAALTGFAGLRAGRLRLDLLRGQGPGRARDERRGDQWDRDDHWDRSGQWERDDERSRDDRWPRPDQTGGYEPVSDAGGQGVYRDGGLYRPGPAYGEADPGGERDRPGYDWQDEDAAGRTTGYGEAGYYGNGEQAGPGDGYPPAGGKVPAGYDTGDLSYARLGQPGYGAGPYGPAGYEPDGLGNDARGGEEPGSGQRAGASRLPGSDQPARSELYGQIAIYTLLEDRVAEFDRLSERVVEQVRADEPETLVYIVHAVPSAPMQRILYEVYRDRAAYEEHRHQPYVAKFDIDRRPYVLATNVIELGLQQAKVSPFPSVAELLGEPAFDTSGFERPDYLRDYGKSASARDASRSRDRR